MIKYLTLKERLALYSIPEPNSGCFLWTKSCNSNGYGNLSFKGEVRSTHRWTWEAYNGPIPEGMHVLHRCDTPPCVNPDHMFLGSHQENMADCSRKGRFPYTPGELNPFSKLTEKEVLEIRNSQASQRKMAKHYNVNQALINRIRNRKIWTHI
jgi:hypothetical protein